MHDYIPAPDEEFDTFAVTQFGPYALAHAAALSIPADQVTALGGDLAAWGVAWPDFVRAETAYHAATEEKRLRRRGLVATIRRVAGTVQANAAVTDAQKENLGITVRKTTKTPVAIPTTTPSLQRADTSTRAILRLFIVDATTPDSRAKPPGVQGCEIREQVGGSAPTDPEAMAFLAIETRSPYRADFDAPDIGKTAYIALRWINTRGQPGPWSQVYSAVIPG